MKKEFRISNATLVLTAIIGSLIVMAMVTGNSIRLSRRTSDATDDAVSTVSAFYLEAMADRRAKTITNLINGNFDEMEKAVTFIDEEGVTSQTELRECIGKVKALLGLNRFAMVDKDDIVYTQYTTYTGRSRHPFLSEVGEKDRIITTVSSYGSSKQLCLAIATPDLTIMGKEFKACFVQLDISDIVELLAFDDQGRTHFALYAKNGGNLSDTELGPVILDHNFFDALKGIISDDDWNRNYESFQNEEEGSIVFDSGPAEETLCYVPIEGTGWEMAVLIRDSVIQDQIRDISEKNLEANRDQIIFAVVAVIVLAAIILIQLRQLAKERIEKEKETSRNLHQMANTDSLTGVRNKHAYSENEAIINSQIESGDLSKLGVVVGDVNGLKYVNDTQGHAAGDNLIKEASTLICAHFKHGAVFRIGGDEFAIILQGKGYDSMSEAIDRLNRRVEENINSNRVVVSIGHAVLTQDDHQLKDVFERADQMMYERKKELKSMGAKQRDSI